MPCQPRRAPVFVRSAGGPIHLSWRLFMPPEVRLFGAVSAIALLAGCAVGPDFKKPAAPDVSSYTAQPLAAATATPGINGGEAQSFAKGGDITGDWWTLYHSPALDSLIAQAVKNNADLQAAAAALKSAHETALAGRGAFLPS